MSSLTAGWILSGASSQWRNAKPGKVFDALVNGSYANPVITDADDGTIIGGEFDGQLPEDVYDEFTDYGYFNSSQFDTDTFGPVRGVTAAAGQWHHDLSATYNTEKFSVTLGVNNLTDEEPPLIDQAAGPNRNNAVTSARYDVVGRSYFLRLQAAF